MNDDIQMLQNLFMYKTLIIHARTSYHNVKYHTNR